MSYFFTVYPVIFSHLFTTSDGTHTDLCNTRGAGDPHTLSDVGKHAGSCLRPKMESQAPSPETNPMWNRERQGNTPVTSRRSLGVMLQPGDQIPGIHTQCGRESDDVDQSDVALPALDGADVGAVHPRLVRQFLLGQSAFFAPLMHTGAEFTQEVIFAGHIPNVTR